jgi:hypothetical protein
VERRRPPKVSTQQESTDETFWEGQERRGFSEE